MFILNRQNSIATHFVAELRDVHLQKDRIRFRKNLERLGEIMAYEISKEMTYIPQVVETPFQELSIPLIHNQPVVVAILRAAIPFFQGVLNFFDQSDCGFIGAFRNENGPDDGIEIKLGYSGAPSLDGKEVILVDPMLATGKSFVASIDELMSNGRPTKIHILSVIASPEGVDYISKHVDCPFKIWTCALDDHLNDLSYIVPGLGDAGDLAFGPKL